MSGDLDDRTCTWTQDDEGSDIWEAGCSTGSTRVFEFNHDGPLANGFAFCPYCAKPISEQAWTCADEDDPEVPHD